MIKIIYPSNYFLINHFFKFEKNKSNDILQFLLDLRLFDDKNIIFMIKFDF